MIKKFKKLTAVILSAFLVVSGVPANIAENTVYAAETVDLAQIPSYTGSPYTVLNDNVPDFPESDFNTESFETYGELDSLGRCSEAYANIGNDLMPTEERGSIGKIKPSGWHTVKYDCVDGKYLYNRCHLIGYQLTAENANEQNLITGTRYLNVEGMLPFENMVADYIKETGNHVLYKVTPLYAGDNLVATGVQMEAQSVEDDGIQFNVFCYNVQPGVDIDYATGDSWQDDLTPASDQFPAATEDSAASGTPEEPVGNTYIININTGKFHYPTCRSVKQMNDSNKKEVTDNRENLISQGYSPCGNCNP